MQVALPPSSAFSQARPTPTCVMMDELCLSIVIIGIAAALVTTLLDERRAWSSLCVRLCRTLPGLPVSHARFCAIMPHAAARSQARLSYLVLMHRHWG